MKLFLSLFLLISTFVFGESIHILAAANLAKVLDEIKINYLKNHPNDQIDISYLASGKAYAQIKNQAPVDLFVSADTSYPEKLYQEKLSSRPTIYAQGILVLFSKTQKITSINDTLRAKNIALPNPDLAPYGRAANEALNKLNLKQKISSSIRQATSISQAHQWVETKNCDMGFGALSLIDKNDPQMSFIQIDSKLYQPINQALIITNRGEKNNLARDFAKFIINSKTTFKKYGYIIPNP